MDQSRQIAYLLSECADKAVTEDDQIALQAAIWQVDGFGDLATTSASSGNYAKMVDPNNLGYGDVSESTWLTPGRDGSHDYQGLVTRVPGGGKTLMLLGAVLVGLDTLRRRLRA